MLLRAVSLDAARCAGDTGRGVEGECVVNVEGKIAVAAGRDKSRRVDGVHGLMITRHLSTWRPLSPVLEQMRAYSGLRDLEGGDLSGMLELRRFAIMRACSRRLGNVLS